MNDLRQNADGTPSVERRSYQPFLTFTDGMAKQV